MMEILETTCNTCGTTVETRKINKRAKIKKVFQWAYRNNYDEHWKVARRLLTEREVNQIFDDCDLVKISGPYDVPV